MGFASIRRIFCTCPLPFVERVDIPRHDQQHHHNRGGTTHPAHPDPVVVLFRRADARNPHQHARRYERRLARTTPSIPLPLRGQKPSRPNSIGCGLVTQACPEASPGRATGTAGLADFAPNLWPVAIATASPAANHSFFETHRSRAKHRSELARSQASFQNLFLLLIPLNLKLVGLQLALNLHHRSRRAILKIGSRHARHRIF